MYAITGVTGRVGGAAAQHLLASGQAVRAVVRDPAKAQALAAQGAEIAVADVYHAEALAASFAGADGVFVMIPPYFMPQPGYPEAHAMTAALRSALETARPGRIVALSSVGAERESGLGLITQSHILEQALSGLDIPVAFVRAAWFLENSLWDIPTVRATGELPTFLSPLDRPFPMVATEDIGRLSADLLTQSWTETRIVEIEGPRRYSQNDIAGVFAALLGRPVTPQPLPRDRWAGIFEAQGATPETAAPRIEMLDGFHSGWIDFGTPGAEHVVGTVTLEQVLAPALAPSPSHA